MYSICIIGIGKSVYFYYDSNNSVTAMSLNDTMYYYIKNLQGDVTKIVDEKGKVMVEYTYDATKSKSQKKEKHHIVAKKAARAFYSRKILQKANIGINSTYNLVYVKYRLHRCMHHDKVYRLLSKGEGE